MDHPRPQFRRTAWQTLDGPWQFAYDDSHGWAHPREVEDQRDIEVPYAPESLRSGVGDTGFHGRCWYGRRIDAGPLRRQPGDRVMLHFGAVDYRATVWVDGQRVARHVGGHSPFSVDITECLDGTDGTATVTVLAEDDPLEMHKPRGKQDWHAEPHSIWYPRTSGIWRTVWLERVPSAHLARLRWTPDFGRWRMGFTAHLEGARQGMTLTVTLRADGLLLTQERVAVIGDSVAREIQLPDPGIDDARAELQWSPEHPQLLDATVELHSAAGALIDRVDGYTAIRSVRVEDNRFLLNDRPYELRMVLDQGYWPDSLMTADSERLRADVELIRRLGFNGVRKHQKLEDPRYLHWADRLGLLVWGEMPSAYRFTRESVQRLTVEWTAALERDISHPCIVAWVPFNESWGVPNLPDNPAERHYVQALYHLTKTLDPTRPVVGNDGWESVATDIIGIHDYEVDPARIDARYQAPDIRANLRTQRFGGRILIIPGHHNCDHPLVLTEFGGIALSSDAATWGYARADGPQQLERRLRALFAAVRQQDILAGYCYTQFADTYQEANGLLFADRTPKLPLERIAALHGLGPQGPGDPEA